MFANTKAHSGFAAGDLQKGKGVSGGTRGPKILNLLWETVGS